MRTRWYTDVNLLLECDASPKLNLNAVTSIEIKKTSGSRKVEAEPVNGAVLVNGPPASRSGQSAQKGRDLFLCHFIRRLALLRAACSR